MLFRNMFLKYYDEAGADGAAGGGATEPVKTYTQAEVDEMTKGLKESRDALLSEKKQTAAKAKEAEAARLLAEQEAARKSGELDKFEASLRGEFEKERGAMKSQLDALMNRVTSESKRAVLGSFAADFNDPASLEIVSQLIKTEFDGSDVKTQYTDFAGNVITTDAAEFKKWMANHPAISHLMKSDIPSGGMDVGGKDTKGGAFVSQNATPLDRKRAELRNKLNSKFK